MCRFLKRLKEFNTHTIAILLHISVGDLPQYFFPSPFIRSIVGAKLNTNDLSVIPAFRM